MSISHDILNCNLAEVKRRLALGASINDFDAYGYTPLIISIMTRQEAIFELLLSKGAAVNQCDLFGQPPLHWAILLAQENMCRRLLEREAFSNTVSSYGEPLLVYPLLRQDKAMVELLTSYETSKTAAQDYIFCKFLGHLFEMQGFGSYVNYNNIISLVDYQGFRLEFALLKLSSLFEIYTQLAGKPLPHSSAIADTLKRAIALRKYKAYFPDQSLERQFTQSLGAVNLLAMAFDGHAVSLVYSDHYLLTCDRAQGNIDTLTLYELKNPLFTQDISFLLYGRKTRTFWNEFRHGSNLRRILTIPLPYQKVGNCSWANFMPTPFMINTLIELEKKEPLPNPSDWLHLFQSWEVWVQHYMIKETLLRISNLEGDRQLCLTSGLLDIMRSHPSLKESLEASLKNLPAHTQNFLKRVTDEQKTRSQQLR